MIWQNLICWGCCVVMNANNRYLDTANFLVALRSVMHKSFPKITREKTSLVNMMIHIYVREREHGDITITSASYSSDLPKTTAMRRLDILIKNGYIMRYKNCRDGRCIYVSLSEEGHEEVEKFLKRASQICETFVGHLARSGDKQPNN